MSTLPGQDSPLPTRAVRYSEQSGAIETVRSLDLWFLRGRMPGLLLLIAVAAAVFSPRSFGQERNYETIRFFTKQGRAEKVESFAVSPDGRYLALSFSSDTLNSRPGISIIDLQKMTLLGSHGHYSYFTLAFSSDSSRVMGIGGYAGTKIFNLATGRIEKVRLPANEIGRVGIQIEERNGKLLVGKVHSKSNPTLGNAIKVGDEILAYNEGPKPTRYDDSREWKSLLGKSTDDAIKAITGSPGTWVQLRLSRRGIGDPLEVSLQRQWAGAVNRRFPDRGESMTVGVYRKGDFGFRSADTLRECAFVALRDVESSGLGAISPDGKRYAWMAQVRNGREFCVEVHSLERGVLETSAILDASNYRDMHFSSDSSKVLVGTRDTVEVLKVGDSEWDFPISLTSPEKRDNGRVVTRRIPLGFGLPGDLFTTRREVVYSRPAALSRFCVSPNGVLAVGSESGDIFFVSADTRERVGVLGEKILGGRAGLFEITPTGGHLIAFAKGVLHIFRLETATFALNEDVETR